MLRALVDQGWLTPLGTTRALRLQEPGRAPLAALLDVTPDALRPTS